MSILKKYFILSILCIHIVIVYVWKEAIMNECMREVTR